MGVEGMIEVKAEVKRHFEQFFSESDLSRPVLDDIDFPKSSKMDNTVLTTPFTIDEIREAIWSCDGNKSPGLDGFNFNFFKSCWELIKEEVFRFIQEFHFNASFPKAISASFLALIPKKDNPQSLQRF